MEQVMKKDSWLREPKAYLKCPHCNIGEFSMRIPRPAYVKLLFGNKIRRYQCDNCRRKAYLRSSDH